VKFAVGDPVAIIKLKKHGVVTSILNAQSVTVQVGSVSFRCKVSELTPHSASKKKSSAKDKVSIISDSLINSRSRHESMTVDLHGKTVVEALRSLEKALNSLALSGGSRLEIVHGHGSGKVMRAVHDYLSETRVVKNFKVDEINTGMTVAYL
jgi:DNA mismatch repair protein MutS2